MLSSGATCSGSWNGKRSTRTKSICRNILDCLPHRRSAHYQQEKTPLAKPLSTSDSEGPLLVDNGLISTPAPATAVVAQVIVYRGVEERDCGPRERMVSGERGQRAAAMMVGEVDRRYTADTVKCFRSEMRDAAESHLRQREGVRGP